MRKKHLCVNLWQSFWNKQSLACPRFISPAAEKCIAWFPRPYALCWAPAAAGSGPATPSHTNQVLAGMEKKKSSRESLKSGHGTNQWERPAWFSWGWCRMEWHVQNGTGTTVGRKPANEGSAHMCQAPRNLTSGSHVHLTLASGKRNRNVSIL